MNEALRTPSPKRFCRKLGIRNAAAKASAASLSPRKCASTRWRTRPVTRLNRIPAATSGAADCRASAIPPRDVRGQLLEDSLSITRQEPGHAEHPFLGLSLGTNRKAGPGNLPELDAFAPAGMLEQLLLQFAYREERLAPGRSRRALQRGFHLRRRPDHRFVPLPDRLP